jgi:hypothetical protein
MTGKVIDLRKATERPIRIAKRVAIGAVAVVVVGGVAMVVIGARHRAERKSLKRGIARAVDAASNPAAAAKKAARGFEEGRANARAELRQELLQELKKELKKERTTRDRILAAALRSAASAAVPIVLKQLQQRRGAGANGKNAAASGSDASSNPRS